LVDGRILGSQRQCILGRPTMRRSWSATRRSTIAVPLFPAFRRDGQVCPHGSQRYRSSPFRLLRFCTGSHIDHIQRLRKPAVGSDANRTFLWPSHEPRCLLARLQTIPVECRLCRRPAGWRLLANCFRRFGIDPIGGFSTLSRWDFGQW
jgi:hypothetical protein